MENARRALLCNAKVGQLGGAFYFKGQIKQPKIRAARRCLFIHETSCFALQSKYLLRRGKTFQSSCPPRTCFPPTNRSTNTPRSILGNRQLRLGSCNLWWS